MRTCIYGNATIFGDSTQHWQMNHRTTGTAFNRCQEFSSTFDVKLGIAGVRRLTKGAATQLGLSTKDFCLDFGLLRVRF